MSGYRNTGKTKERPLQFEINRPLCCRQTRANPVFLRSHTHTFIHVPRDQAYFCVFTSSTPCLSICNSLLPTSKKRVSEMLLLPWKSLLAAIISEPSLFIFFALKFTFSSKRFQKSNKTNFHSFIWAHL